MANRSLHGKMASQRIMRFHIQRGDKSLEPLEFIEALRKTDKHIEHIYMNGGCYQFYKVLKKIYPSAEPYINEEKNHIATKIGDSFYDITGHARGLFHPLINKDEIEMCKKWRFDKDYWLYKTCPHCDEKIIITN